MAMIRLSDGDAGSVQQALLKTRVSYHTSTHPEPKT